MIGGNHHDVGQRRADTSLADKSGTTPLMLAAAGVIADLVLALSASGVEVDKPNREGLTALQVAAGRGRLR